MKAETKRMYYHSRCIPLESMRVELPVAKQCYENMLTRTLTDECLPKLKEYGIEIIELRCVWSEIEQEEGVFDLSRIRNDIKILKGNGIGVGIFPWFQYPPAWVQDITMLKCVVHGTENTLMSLWDKKTLAAYDRLYAMLARELGEDIDFIYAGIYGDFGEVCTVDVTKHYHFMSMENHKCLWCGDDLARADYKNHLMGKYETVEALNKAWGTDVQSFDDDLMATQGNVIMKLDFARWYVDSMMEFADQVCAIIRKHFPHVRIGLPIGHPDEHIEAQNVKSQAAKIAAKYNMCARWTGLMLRGDFARNHILTRRVSTAAKFYGAEFGLEASLILNRETALDAIYETLSNNATLLHNDPGNILRAEEIYSQFKQMDIEEPFTSDLAIFYPVEAEQCKLLDVQKFYEEMGSFRKRCDYEIADSYMIKDGYLKTIKSLLLTKNTILTRETLSDLENWVRDGGVVYVVRDCEPTILETGEKATVGQCIDGYDFFGVEKDVFYTAHGNYMTEYHPSEGIICHVQK